MVDIETVKDEIVERLKPLQPEKIILFGSYADGTANQDSDIDLFVIKDYVKSDSEPYELQVRKKLRDLIFKYHIGFDVLCETPDFLKTCHNSFYRIDILQKGRVLYAQ